MNALLQKAGVRIDAAMVDEARAVVDDPAFSGLESSDQYMGWLILGDALLVSHDDAQAHAIAVRLTAMADADGQAWRLRFGAASSDDQAEELLCLVQIADKWPDQLATISESYIARAIGRASGAPTLADARFQLLQGLWADHWPGAQSTFAPDDVWSALVDAYLAHGQSDRAAEVAAAITDPRVLIGLRADRRYDALKASTGDSLDIAKAQSRHLEALKAIAAAHPNQLAPVNDVLAELVGQSRIDEAASVLVAVDARIKAETPKQPAYEDEADQRNWIEDQRSTLLLLRGHEDAAVAAETHAASLPESGGPNVSQAINLGDLLIGLNRPKAALAAVAGLTDDHSSPYGRMQAWNVRACAYAELKDDAAYQAELKKMRDHVADSPSALEQVLLCADDLDGAATLLIARLNNADQRQDALREVQLYLRPPHEPAQNADMDRREQEVAQRPAVKAAIDAVGHVLTVPRLGPGWF
jgi:hypothetical protein